MRIDEKLRVIYETIAPSVTRTENAWKEYLKFGSRIFKHNFDNALLVYAQSPKLTMLATTPIWNKVGRYINKGEKGTAVCEYENAKLTLKYLFDVSQTNGNKTPEVWSLDEGKSKSLSGRLAYSYNLDTVDLSDCITQISEQRVFETFDDYMQEFENDVVGHFLSELPREAVTGVIMETIENSVKYFVACRCGITDMEMNVPTISHFDTIPLIARLGHSVTEISKGILAEIERNVKIIENERSNQNEQRNSREQEITRIAEQSATRTNGSGRVRAVGQIRQDGDRISARTESPKIFTFEDARNADGENAQGGQRGESENRGDNTEIITPRPDAADGRHNGENTPSEQAEGYSGGNRTERDSIREAITALPPTIEESSQKESLDSGSFSLPQNKINQGTPLWVQYQNLTEQYPNRIIFKQLGDFYEVMGKNTKTVSDNLGLVPSSRDVGLQERIPLIGIPIHTLDGNVDALLSLGYGVVIANSDGTITERKALETETTISDEGKNIGDYEIPASKARPRNDMPHRNYRAFNQLFPQIVDGTYNYLRLESDGQGAASAFEPLSVERIGGNQISIMHTFIQNGDLMRDPDMVLEIDTTEQTIHALSYELSSMGVYQEVKANGYINTRLQKELNSFLSEWLTNIKNQGYTPVRAVALQNDEDVEITFGDAENSITKQDNTPLQSEIELKEIETENFRKDFFAGIEGSAEKLNDATAELDDLIEKQKNADAIKAMQETLADMPFDELQNLLNTKIVDLSEAMVQNNNIDDFKDELEEIEIISAEINQRDVQTSKIISGSQEKQSTKPPPTVTHKINYHYSNEDNLYAGGAKTKYKANIEAIKLLKRLESDKRLATSDEQKILANYVGWGGLANVFSSTASGWENEYQELKHLLDEDEYKAAMNSTITAYYTEPKLIEYMYKALDNFGFVGGEGRKILDPAMGTGNFFSTLPKGLEDVKLYGVELDSITGRIAKQLYQKAYISVQGFETTRFEDNSFDVAIGNIPFNNIKVFDRRYAEQDFLIHDYFLAKSLDLVKSGGIVAYITTKGTMDKRDTSVREYIAQRADLIGAIRLPNTAFKALAGTEVTADILFFQKLPQMRNVDKFQLPDWVFASIRQPDYIPLNQYFIDNPEMILGEMQFSRNMYGREDGTACIPPENQDLYAELDRAINSLSATFTAEPDEIKQSVDDELDLLDETDKIKADVGTKNSTYVIKDDTIYFCENGYLEKQDIKGKEAERIKGLCEIKTALLSVIAVQSREYNRSELETAQKKLNEVYDGFVKNNGYINSKPNIAAFSDDDQFALLCSIEDENDDKATYSKAPIFTRATIKSYKQPTYAESAKEALEISLNVKMKVDLSYMADLYGKPEDDIISELGDRIYLNPQKYYGNSHEGWETNEEYLSGNVADKLAYAILKADDNELFKRNVEALKAVQPPKLMPSDIDFRIGSPWIPIEYFKQFMYETFGTQSYYQNNVIDLSYLEYTTTWRISGKNSDSSIKVNQTYGTGRMNAYEIYEDCLNLQSATVRDRVDYTDANGKDQVKYVVNAAETMIARSKQQQIKEAFSSWLFSDSDRAEILLNIYNEKFNTIRPREYDGSHLVFPNMNEERELRKHQKDVAARIIYNGTCLMAHEVGAGKTAAMIAAGVYMKNIGAVKKPIYVVPNHLTNQWATEFYRFFPAANLLVTSKKDFEKHNRKKFVSKIAMGNYDAIIIGHSQFEKIAISKERQEKQLNEEISHLTHVISQMKQERGENWAIKQIVIFQNNLKTRLEKLLKEERKDDLLVFEQLGVDYMFVDEAHVYKNCFTYTKMRNVAGIGKSSSQRASDMLLKCQYLQEINQGKGVTFATGTPISNSMSEMFVMQRYLQPNLLKKLGLHYFDSWAATFGEVTSSLEITPEGSGYRMKNRFSKFHNLPELMNMFRLVADIQTADMLNLPVPELEGGKANIIVTQCSDFQKQIMDDFVIRADAIRKREVEPTTDNMLKLTNEAKLMAIDPRLVYADAPNDPDSKLNTCIRNVYDKWVETSEDRLTQVIFCDSGTPKPGQFNVYDETKSQLIKMGVPENEIAFVHDAKTDAQRDDMFEKVRTGVIRVILGSTSKLGTGTNIQDLLVAEHDLDVPWRPSDITQRSGRILRQGNNNPVVNINRYVTKGTFDSYLWQIQEQKLRYITQVMTGKSISRSCEDTDETVLSAAEVKAIATSNPLLAEKMEVDNEVTRLKLLKGNWSNERLVLIRDIEKAYPTTIKVCEERIANIKADIVTEQKTTGQDFKITIDGTVYTERTKAGDAFVTVMKAKCEAGEGAVVLGEYRGFSLMGIIKSLNGAEIRLRGEETYKTDIGDSALGCITRIENLVGRLPNILSETEITLEKTRAEFEEAKIAVIKPFEFEDKLNEFVARQSEINTKLEFAELSKQEETILDDKGSDASNSEKLVNASESETDEEYDNDSVYATYGVEV